MVSAVGGWFLFQIPKRLDAGPPNSKGEKRQVPYEYGVRTEVTCPPGVPHSTTGCRERLRWWKTSNRQAQEMSTIAIIGRRR